MIKNKLSELKHKRIYKEKEVLRGVYEQGWDKALDTAAKNLIAWDGFMTMGEVETILINLKKTPSRK